jgi:hypothetical protein
LLQPNLNSFFAQGHDYSTKIKKKGLSCSPWQPKFLLPKDMIVPQGKKGLNFSMGQLKLLFLKDMIIPQRKKQLPQETMNFLQGKA